MIGQKATVLCVLEVLQKYTDEEHCISTEKIKEKLKVLYGIDMDRRTVYRNIDALISMGYDIQGYSQNREGYCLMDRTFAPSEVRLLCDAVAASDMIAPEISKKMIKRLADMLSIFESRMLQRTVYVKEHKEISNHRIFYNIDTLNIAISQGSQVSLKKLYHHVFSGLTPTSDSPLIFNPYATLWAEGNYYVIGKEEGEEELIHLRIDRIKDIQILEQTVEMVFGGINPSQYAEKYIYKKGEQLGSYEIECVKELWEDLTDTFGEHVTCLNFNAGKLQVRVKTIPSAMKSWILTHCDKCEVIGPKAFREQIQTSILQAYQKYW